MLHDDDVHQQHWAYNA